MVMLAMAGCANAPAPVEQMKLTSQAIEQAREVGATEDSSDFSLAQAKLIQAQQAMREENYKMARVLAEQAELDARLAEAKAVSGKSQAHIEELNKQIKRLRKRLGEPE